MTLWPLQGLRLPKPCFPEPILPVLSCVDCPMSLMIPWRTYPKTWIAYRSLHNIGFSCHLHFLKDFSVLSRSYVKFEKYKINILYRLSVAWVPCRSWNDNWLKWRRLVWGAHGRPARGLPFTSETLNHFTNVLTFLLSFCMREFLKLYSSEKKYSKWNTSHEPRRCFHCWGDSWILGSRSWCDNGS